MKSLLSATALAAAMWFAGSANAATVVDFDEFAHTGSAKLHGRTISSGGFTFSSSGAQGLSSWGVNHASNADPGGAALMNWGGGLVTVRKNGGGLFNLASIDLNNGSNGQRSFDITLVFFDGIATTSQTVTLDDKPGTETFVFNRNVEWFRIEPFSSQNFQFDNLRWSDPVTSAVPEPASWAMMIVGFGAGGAMIRRSRRTRALLA